MAKPMAQAMNPLRLPSNPRILVVVLRRLGDVLLTTPLIRSIKRAYPDAAIEALVFAGTEGILAGNPDLAGVIAVPQRLGVAGSLSLLVAARRGATTLRSRRSPATGRRRSPGSPDGKARASRSERIIGLAQTAGAQPVLRDRPERSTAFSKR